MAKDTDNKKSKFLFGVLVILPLLLYLYSFLEKKHGDEESYFYQKLEQFLTSKKDEVSTKELTNFNWHEVCYVWPYGGVSDMRISKFKLNKKIPEDDSQDYLVFLNTANMTGVLISIEAGRILTEKKDEDKEYDGCGNIENSVIKAVDSSKFLLTKK